MPVRTRIFAALFVLAVAACGTTPKDPDNNNPDGGNTQNDPKVSITGTDPAGTLTVGAQATVLGKGFGDTSHASITLDTATVTTFLTGSDDGHLVFTVPALADLPEAGKSVTLKVTSSLGTATTTVTVKPAAAALPDGSLFVVFQRAPMIRPPGPGGGANLTFQVQAITNADEKYTIMAAATNGWTASVLDEDGNPTTTLDIAKSDAPDGSSQSVTVHYDIPASAADESTAQLMVFVASQKNPRFMGFSSLMTLMPNTWPEPPIVPMACVKTGDAFAEGFVQAAPGTGAQLTIRAILPAAGAYHRTAEVVNDPDHKWTISGDLSDVNAAGDGATEFNVKVTPAAGAPPAELHVMVTPVDDETGGGLVVVPIRIAQ